MKKYLKPSNLIFIILLAAIIYTPSREWLLRQVAFSPSSIDAKEARVIDNYHWNLRGVTAADFNFESLKGKVVLVNFWATWCPPCRAEMPMLQKLYNDYKDKVVFVLVTNENTAKVQTFFEKNNYNFPVYNSLSNVPKLFAETNSIPSTYLIDQQGRVRMSKNGAADWNSNSVRKFIDKLLVE